jgi:hypothetical protein
MGLNSRQLPVCDSCGKEWLPEEGPAREDPRGYAITRWLNGEPPVRCGKCKTPYWDREFTGVSSKATLEAFIQRIKTEPFTIHNEGGALPLPPIVVTSCGAQDPEFVKQIAPELVKAVLRQRCRHGLLSCPQCSERAA